MRIFSVLLISICLFQIQCNVHTPDVKITNQLDPDIVLVNLGVGDRATIAEMLLKIDSSKPALIAIDALFLQEKDRLLDSALEHAFKSVQKDIIVYGLDSIGEPERSHRKFRVHLLDEGLATLERVNGLSERFVPIRKIGNITHEHFALKIVKHWKPGFNYSGKINKSIPISFTRTLGQFRHVNDEITDDDLVENFFTGKIVMVGYIGPTNEDKHFTPLRFVGNYSKNEPDTYGVVVLANAVRTLLDYDKK
jgi:CHASE2 domain-containing sensor protein